MSELSPTGQLLFDAHFPPHDQSYRSLRFHVDGDAGAPARLRHPPGTARRRRGLRQLERSHARDRLAVLAGPSASALGPVAEAPRSGFETEIGLPSTVLGPYFTVQALSPSGAVLATAATRKL